MYTVKQVASLAGISVRTLHYYDEIGLFKPTSVGENGYRYYDDAALFDLQQILLFREMGLSLLQIRAIVTDPAFDLVAGLQAHRHTLKKKLDRLQTLIDTVDSTIMHLVGEANMSSHMIFKGFSEEKQKQYEKEAIARYGEAIVGPSIRRWNSYTGQQKEQIQREGGAIYLELAAHINEEVESPQVQALLRRWHQHLRYFYEPTPEILLGLGRTYQEHPDFHAFFSAIHPDLPGFLHKAIVHYVASLDGG